MLIGDAPPIDSGKLLNQARQLKSASIIAAIEKLESEQHRASREVLTALLAGTPSADVLRSTQGIRLLRIEADIGNLRAKLETVSNSRSMADLEAVV
ncbi:hypothetical protein [Chromobacterium amazonense]|uniref:hypothetical protein n=1 Tax=Chromobacterium amazonense TaxID=1382803 RepID=UPI00166F82AB|nr:hypothetical protein [Chromobacterium amazonense]